MSKQSLLPSNIRNRSPWLVQVRSQPLLDRQFPFGARPKAQAYLEQCQAEGRRATLMQLATSFQLRLRRRGIKTQFLTFDTLKQAEQARLKLESDRSVSIVRDYAAAIDELVGLIDQDTCLLNVIYASNISGVKLDLEAIVQKARAIKPDLYILVDAVQHAPHGLIDLQCTPVDGINIAQYKFFGARGSGMAWMSERTAVLPHHKLNGKPAGAWGLGSGVPWQFAALTENGHNTLCYILVGTELVRRVLIMLQNISAACCATIDLGCP